MAIIVGRSSGSCLQACTIIFINCPNVEVFPVDASPGRIPFFTFSLMDNGDSPWNAIVYSNNSHIRIA